MIQQRRALVEKVLYFVEFGVTGGHFEQHTVISYRNHQPTYLFRFYAPVSIDHVDHRSSKCNPRREIW